MNDAECDSILCNDERRATTLRNVFNYSRQLARHVLAEAVQILVDCIGSAFAHFTSVVINTGHARLRRERNEVRFMRRELAPTQSILFFCQDDDRTTFRSFICER